MFIESKGCNKRPSQWNLCTNVDEYIGVTILFCKVYVPIKLEILYITARQRGHEESNMPVIVFGNVNSLGLEFILLKF